MTQDQPSMSSKDSSLNEIWGWFKKLYKFFPIHSRHSLEESVVELIEEHETEGGQIHPEEKAMITKVLGFRNLLIEDVMIPRSDIVAVPIDSTLESLKLHFLDKQHTRMPVYEETLDSIKGFIHLKDVLPYLLGEDLQDIASVIRQILVVPPSMPVLDLLVKMRSSQVHMAVVVDEYGGTDGLVTIEDLVEEIVGEIQDEHDEIVVPDWSIKDDGTIQVNARMEVLALEEILLMPLASEEELEHFHTIGGLIYSLAGKIPQKGEWVSHPSGLQFEIIEAEPRRIHTILVHPVHQILEEHDGC